MVSTRRSSSTRSPHPTAEPASEQQHQQHQNQQQPISSAPPSPPSKRAKIEGKKEPEALLLRTVEQDDARPCTPLSQGDTVVEEPLQEAGDRAEEGSPCTPKRAELDNPDISGERAKPPDVSGAPAPRPRNTATWFRMKPRDHGHLWGKLIAQSSQHPHVNLVGQTFTIGRSRTCSLQLKDQGISGVLCKLKFMQREQGGVTLLENTGNNGLILVNGKHVKKNCNVFLKGGDEIVFSSSRHFSYIFQQLSTSSVSSGAVHSLSENRAAKALQVDESRAGESLDVAGGASILASLAQSSNFPADISQGTDERTKLTMAAMMPPPSDISDSSISDFEAAGQAGKGSDESALPCEAAGEKPAADVPMEDTGLDIGSALELAGDCLGALAKDGSQTIRNEADCSGNDVKFKEAERENANQSSTIAIKRQSLKDEFSRMVMNGEDFNVTFDNFPYYLSESIKQVLITSTYIHLRRPDFAIFANDLHSVSPRILLAGPTGSEIYQEALVKALARHFGARLLVFDSGSFPNDVRTLLGML
ncbi:hypothetical protein KP509_1Z097100 [Ceratopteris richardii]|nr:hypothetical protein KP509_1Z097100 [Ceratopteris richardii]